LPHSGTYTAVQCPSILLLLLHYQPWRGDDHYAVAYYGTDPEDLSQTAKNNIRLNRAHPETIFRVRIQGLKPQTTYYYKVTSMGADGKSDGVESSVNHFTSAAPGQLTSAQPKSQ
jgi:hypothetical protein